MKEFNVTLFSRRLKEERQFKKISQKQMAAELGILQPAYVRLEKCKYQMSFETLVYICQRLEISADYLLGLKD